MRIRRLLLAVAGLVAITPSLASEVEPRIGVQLWSVRDALQEDFDGTLKELAALGFEGVEFAGIYGGFEGDGKALREYLDSVGLVCLGAHLNFLKLSFDERAKTARFHRDAGCESIVVGMDNRAFSPDGIDWVTETLDKASAEFSAYGLRSGYHNHHQEFAAFKSQTYWDYLAANTDESVVLQLDVGNMQTAGADPVAYVRRYPGRTWSTHYKATLPDGAPDSARPIIGEDTIDWRALLKANYEVGGTFWLIVEQGQYPDGMSSMEAVRLSLEGLNAVREELGSE